MACSVDWEEGLDIDDSDILLEGRSSRVPPPHITPPSNILPSKRPSDTEIHPTIGILNRFKKHHHSNTQSDLSVPSDLPPLELCTESPAASNNNNNGNASAEKIISQLQLDEDIVGFGEPHGLDDFPSRHHHHQQQQQQGRQTQIPANQSPGSSTRLVSQQQRRSSNNPQELSGEVPSVEVRDPDIEKRTPRVIPGPAGSIQRALHRKTQQNGGVFFNERPSQNAGCSRIEQEDDADFEENAWLCAMDYIQREMEMEGHGPEFSLQSRIGFIKMRGNMDRIPQVVGIIKACTSNKLGGMLVTLKDPTGTIGGTIHHKIIGETQFGKDISLGAVILLQQVVVFSPTPWAHYLNITLNNVVKVFKRDSCPPLYMGSSFSRLWRNPSTDKFMEVGKAASKGRASSGHTFIGPVDTLVGRIQKDTCHQPYSQSTNDDWDRTRVPQQPDDTEPTLIQRNAISVENNSLRKLVPEHDPKARVSSAPQNGEVYCNKKASIAAMVDWNDEIELLMVDDPDMFT